MPTNKRIWINLGLIIVTLGIMFLAFKDLLNPLFTQGAKASFGPANGYYIRASENMRKRVKLYGSNYEEIGNILHIKRITFPNGSNELGVMVNVGFDNRRWIPAREASNLWILVAQTNE